MDKIKSNSNTILGKKTKPQEDINELLHKSQIENQNESDLDSETIISLLSSIKENSSLNLTQRKQFPNDPSKFIASEEQLNEDISLLHKISAYPSLIPIFIQSKGIELVCSLLSHPNSDIVNPIVNLIEEITEGDFLQELEDPKAFLELLLANNLFTLLVNHLKQLFQEANEEDNEQYKSDILSVLENYIEIYPPSSDILGQKTDILNCLLSSVKYSETIEVKVFSSEILNSLLQNSDRNQAKFAALKGIPHLVNIIVELKEGEAKGGAYEEFTSNIINSICSSLFNRANQGIFSKADGLKVMIEFMMQNNIFRHLAIKVLNYALQHNKENCNSFIMLNGLSVLFPYFMGKGLKKYSNSVLLGEEHCIEIIVNLFEFAEGVERDRLMYKFKEEKYQKCIRLIEMYGAYKDRGMNKGNKKEMDNDIEENEGVNKEEYIFQLITVVCLELIKQSEFIDVRDKVSSLIQVKGIDIIEMKQRINQMIENIGDDNDNDNDNGNDQDNENNNNAFSYKLFLTSLIQ